MTLKPLIITLIASTVVLIPTQPQPILHPSTLTPIVSAPKPAQKLPAFTKQAPALLAAKVTTKAVEAPKASQNNEQIAWDFLIARYSRNQTAGIMGNLMQENHIQTNDGASGLGIAQWMGNRRTNLMAKGNYLDIHVQLQHLHEEMAGISLPNDVVGATVVFQNQFERCGICHENKRIQYAQEIMGRH